MTYEEAMKHYQENVCRFCRAKHCENCPTGTAKTAMEKQIAKKIIAESLPQPIYDEHGDFLIDVYFRKFKCPACGTEIVCGDSDMKHNLDVIHYCESCGQKLMQAETEKEKNEIYNYE